MRKNLALIFLISTLFTSTLFAQKSYNSKPIIKVSKEEIEKTDKHWRQIQRVTPDYQVYFRIKVDTTKWMEDFNGWKFYETKIRFGLKDGLNTSYFELPYLFHGAKATGIRTHLLAFSKGKFFIYAYDLVDKQQINHILFALDPKTGHMQSQLLSNDYHMGYYPRFYLRNENGTDEISKTLDELKLMDVKPLEKFDLEKNGDQEVSLSFWNNKTKQQFDHIIFKKDLKTNTELPTMKATILSDYSKPYYAELYDELKEKVNATKPLISFNQLNYVFSKIHGRKVKSQAIYSEKALLKNIAEVNGVKPNELLVRPFDPEGRQTTGLFINYCYNKSKIISGKDNRKFSETTIRFGFGNETHFYELPFKLYIEYVDRLKNTNPQTPRLLYANHKFYIYVQDYKNSRLNYSMITCDENGNVKKDLLFDNENTGAYGFFNKSEKNEFMLTHYEKEKQLMLKTFLEDGYWKTEIKYRISIADNWAAHTQNYIPNPYFLNPKAEPYQPVYEVTDRGKIIKTGYKNTCIATTDDLLLLAACKKLQAEQSELIASQKLFELTFRELGKRKLGEVFPQIETIYQPLKRNQLLIANMPVIHDQAGFGSCMAYALGAIVQQNVFTYEQYYHNNVIDKYNVPSKFDISYFGLQIFTRGNKDFNDEEADEFSFEGAYVDQNGVVLNGNYNSLNIGYDKKGFFYTNECNNLDNIPLAIREVLKRNYMGWTKEFETNKQYFKDIYTKNKSSANNSNIALIWNNLSKIFGVPIEQIQLIQALKKDTYNKFLKTLFFSCTKGKYVFPNYLHFSQLDISYLPKTAQKQKIIDILSQGKPLIFTHFAGSNNEARHDAVICGYKKVIDPKTKKYKDVFKVQNSYGDLWQYVNVDGWMDADVIIQSLFLAYGKYNITYIDSHLSNESASSYVDNLVLDKLSDDTR